MSDATANAPSLAERRDPDELIRQIAGRRRKGTALRYAGLGAITLALAFLVFLLASIVAQGWTGFLATKVTLPVTYAAEHIAEPGTTDEETIRGGDYRAIVDAALRRQLGLATEAEASGLARLLSDIAPFELRERVLDDPSLIGTEATVALSASSVVDMANKGKLNLEVEEGDRLLSDAQLGWFRTLQDAGDLQTVFNWRLLTSSDSRSPELAGIWTGLLGSLMMLAIVLCFAFPIAVLTAVYLEEFAPKNRWTDLVEININNLAAVPSIIFGLLGLAVFLNTFGFPRSSALAGGAVLTLMTLPIIIIAARSALRSVPGSYRDAALMLGASRQQAVWRQVLPSAMPGMLTGTIIGLAQALGETAPLLLIGMIAFVSAPPDGVTDTATALPVQIYLWANAPEAGFTEKTQAAIMALLIFLLGMNAIAVWLRHRLRRRH